MPNLMGQASAFSSIYVWTEAWQHVGWDSILYIAALSAVDPSLYEAAIAHFLRNIVHAYQKDQVDDIVEKPDRRRKAVLAAHETHLVDIGGYDLTGTAVQRILQQCRILSPRWSCAV